jgi:hypothetical protein
MEQNPSASLETTEASFITMIMDRLHSLEADNDRLKRKVELLESNLDLRSPPITLLSHTAFNDFSDGWGLSWEILKEPTMINERIEGDNTGDADLVPLDDAHWNAVAFPCSTTIIIENDDEMHTFRIGKIGYPVTVRTLVEDMHTQLLRVDCNTGANLQI